MIFPYMEVACSINEKKSSHNRLLSFSLQKCAECPFEILQLMTHIDDIELNSKMLEPVAPLSLTGLNKMRGQDREMPIALKVRADLIKTNGL